MPTQAIFNELRKTTSDHSQQQAAPSDVHESSKSSMQQPPYMFSEPRIQNPSSPNLTLDLHEQQILNARETYRGGPPSDPASLDCSNMFTMNNQFESFNAGGHGLDQHEAGGKGGRLVPVTQPQTNSSAAEYDSKEL